MPPPPPAPAERLRIVLSHVYCWPEVRRGGERYLHELASALLARGHRVQILSTALTASTDSVLGVPVHRFHRRRLRPARYRELSDEAAFSAQALPRALIGRPDAWHALGTADAAVAATAGRVLPFRSVHTQLGVPERPYRDERPDRRLHEVVVRHVDTYVCLSQSAGEHLRAGWGRQPVVVGGGVDLRRLVPAPGRSPHPTLLFSGSLVEPRKNLPLLLQAMAIVRRCLPDAELWLSGPGDPAPLIAAAPAGVAEAVVHLGLGTVEDQADHYGRAWATVLPSVNEAFGLVLVESLACGTPIVARTDGGGPAEIVQPGVGTLAGPSAFDLAEACLVALDLAAEPGTADACREAAGPYDWRDGLAPVFERIYAA